MQTIDFFATGPEDEANQAGLYVYGGPGLSMDLDYNRYIHRLGHDPYGGGPLTPFSAANPLTTGFPPLGGFFDPPLSNLTAGTPTRGNAMWGQDLNVGQDYALRVQQLNVKFKGDITENLSWGFNVWEMRKEGLRQTNSVTHCYNAQRGLDAISGTPDDYPLASNSTCHLVSQGQHVDWLTVEIEPVIKARFDWLTLEYSRTMRSFQQGDDLVTFRHTRGPSLGYGDYATTGIEPAYAYVPENYTEIDRLKVLADVAPNTDLYVLGFVGNTHNRFRESDRKFYGVNGRVTNSTFDGLTMTVYGKTFAQNNSADTVALNARYPAQATTWVEPVAPQTNLSAASPPALLVDRYIAAAGVKGRWRPFYNNCGWTSRLAVVGGYEYRELEASQCHVRHSRTGGNVHPAGHGDEHALRRRPAGLDVFAEFLCALPDDRQRLPAGGRYARGRRPDRCEGRELQFHAPRTRGPNRNRRQLESDGKFPAQRVVLDPEFVQPLGVGQFRRGQLPHRHQRLLHAGRTLGVTGGYATFSNWIDQDITLSNDNPFTNEWDYTGRADVFNLGASYAWTCRLTLIGGLEYVRSRNVFADPPDRNGVVYDPMAVYTPFGSTLGAVTGGVDYRVTDAINTFFRYNYFDYDDAATGWNSGTAHMVLAGLSGVF